MPEALQTANVTLDSVAAVFQPAAAVKEFKMAVEVAIARRARIKDFVRGLNPFRKRHKEMTELVDVS